METPPPPVPMEESFEQARPPRRGYRRSDLLLYIALAGAAAFCLQMARLDMFSMGIGSLVAVLVFWVGFFRLNLYGVGTILAVSIFMSAWNFGAFPVAVLVASALAGGVGAWLTRIDADENDFFFAPLLAAAALMLLLVTLGAGGGWPQVQKDFAKMVQPSHLAFKDPAHAPPEALQAREMIVSIAGEVADADELLRWMDRMVICVPVLIFTFALWLIGRLARRLLGQLKGLRPSLIMFRIHYRYIFLLILGLILWILSSLALRGNLPEAWSTPLSYLAWPILGIVGLAGMLAGLGIILFLAAIRRMAGQVQSAFWIALVGTVVALFFAQFTALVGVADVWLDLRKLEKLRRQLEAGPQDQKD